MRELSARSAKKADSLNNYMYSGIRLERLHIGDSNARSALSHWTICVRFSKKKKRAKCYLNHSILCTLLNTRLVLLLPSIVYDVCCSIHIILISYSLYFVSSIFFNFNMDVLDDIEASCVIYALYDEHELSKK